MMFTKNLCRVHSRGWKRKELAEIGEQQKGASTVFSPTSVRSFVLPNAKHIHQVVNYWIHAHLTN